MKIFKRSLFILLVLLLIFTTSVTAYADGNAIYNGDAKKFIFAPGSEHSPTDMFTAFKDVMPGDVLSQRIFVKNDSSNGVKVKIYMRSLGAVENVEFLKQLNLSVKKVDDTVLFDSTADQPAQLTDWVELGMLYSGGEVELDILLDIPTSLDNTNKNLIGKLDWEFAVEELPIEPSDPKPPETGDNSNVYIWISLLVFSGVLFILLLIFRFRKKSDKGNGGLN